MVYCMHLYSLTVRVYNVLASRSHWVDPKISGKHRGGKKISTGRRSVIQRKDKERKKGREKGEVLAVVLSQYVATIAEQDERRRWSWAPPCLEVICGCNPGGPQTVSQCAWRSSTFSNKCVDSNAEQVSKYGNRQSPVVDTGRGKNIRVGRDGMYLSTALIPSVLFIHYLYLLLLCHFLSITVKLLLL